ncbi:MAG: carboxypeptidase M32 [Gemmatimonadota bacterium]|nr:carboxypeptidase M32 [Gemmatimonadota bacterium]MDP7031221.1 carboxypeptidase M32 [Gemmatimonadota bacterium]
MTKQTPMEALLDRWGEYEDIQHASMVLEWDQETHLPTGAGEARSQHLATLAGLSHEKLTAPAFRKALTAAERDGSLKGREQAMVREAKRTHDRARRVPRELVMELALAESRGLAAWKTAREEGQWSDFAENLSTLVRLKRRLAEAVGYQDTPYDALLEDFEPGATVKQLDPLLGELKEATVDLLGRIRRSKRRPDRKLLRRKFPKEGQLRLGRMVAETMGFDFTEGRLDLSTHPFCTSFHMSDVRLTTRVDERDLKPSLFGVIHEAGHGLYEQGIGRELARTPLGDSISLGIHESQSRLWENLVGRSRPFWKHCLPRARRVFPEALRGVRLDDFVFAINDVRPSMIRVEADEVTYNLHIILRYELEKELFSGELQPENLPEAWNRKMKELLGIVPRNASEGVLQDIHWAMGLMGYFPTYSLGNLYACQLYNKARKSIRGLDRRVENGKLLPLRDWLRTSIHAPGKTYSAAELIQRATGSPLSTKPFVDYANAKFGELYGL